MTTPVTPGEAAARKAAALPDEIIDVFNELIALAFDGRTATVMQEDAVAALTVRLGISREEVFGRHLLDIEPVYQAAGWQVRYDKPGFNGSYAAYWVFSQPGG